ncbi:hypothetical protein EDB83DRAFT_2669386 [Lactarius deliciosus]|nr:hypothetical protein EDB83DRAFT_2669386 [Lactarius deliciosus]
MTICHAAAMPLDPVALSTLGWRIYAVAIQEQLELVKKWGPRDDAVDPQWGPEITGDPELRDWAHLKPFALGGTNNHEDHDNPKYWTLDSLMDLNGRTFIDIEGGEFDALTAFLGASAAAKGDVLPVGQLQLEIEGHEKFEYFARWWAALEAAGVRPFWTEPNLVYINLVRGVRPELADYSFINIRGNHALVNEAFN